MQTLLIASKDKERAINYAKKLCKDNGIDFIDIDIHFFEKTVGIEDIRNFQKKLFLKPIKSKTKSLILDIKETLTDAAQNALLKVLEEPPNNTIIILTIDRADRLLPTVLSRCSIIELKSSSKTSIDPQYRNILVSLSRWGVGERLKFAQDNSKTKEEAKMFLENLILAGRQVLIDKPTNPEFLKMLKSLNKTHIILSTTNANQRLVLENLLLSL